MGDGREQGIAVRDPVRLDTAVIDGAGRGELIQSGNGKAARSVRDRIGRRSHRDDVLGKSDMSDRFETVPVLPVAPGMDRGVVVDDTASAGI